jgi:hypothetical protein
VDRVQSSESLWHPRRQLYVACFCCALTFAHLALCAAAILFLPAADIVRLGLAAPALIWAVLFAHRAFCARLIRLRAEADRVCFGLL